MESDGVKVELVERRLGVRAMAFPAGDLRMRVECQSTVARLFDFFSPRPRNAAAKGTGFHSAVSRCRQFLSPVPNGSPKLTDGTKRSRTECSEPDCTEQVSTCSGETLEPLN